MSAGRRRACHAPYPELVEAVRGAAPWRVLDSRELPDAPSPGMVDKVRRRIAVPLAAEGRAIALHELGHVRWSPRRLPAAGVPRGFLLAVEDARVNLALEGLGLPVRLGARERARVGAVAASDLERGDRVSFVLRAVASLGTNAGAAVLASAGDEPRVQALAARWHGRVGRVLEVERACRGKDAAPFASAERLARELARELTALGLDGEPFEGSACLHAVRGACGEAADDAGDELARLLRRGRGGRRVADEGPPPGRLAVTAARLAVRCPAARGGRAPRWVPAREGSVLRFPHRAALDGAVFRRRSRGRGGTVLVDASGSMSLDAGDVERIVEGAPWATLVAVYSGRGEEGELRVVARDGRRARGPELATPGRGNVVDLPALAWLAKQPGPRVWLSDGRVTGSHDVPSRALDEACARTCARARIRRVRTVEEAARILGGRRGAARA